MGFLERIDKGRTEQRCKRCGARLNGTGICPQCSHEHVSFVEVGETIGIAGGPDEAGLRDAYTNRTPVAFRLRMPGYGAPEEYSLVITRLSGTAPAFHITAVHEFDWFTVRGDFDTNSSDKVKGNLQVID